MADNNLNINFGQTGIAAFPSHALFATFTLNGNRWDAYGKWLQLAKITDRLCAANDYRTVCVRGVGYELWALWCEAHKMPLPKAVTGHGKLKSPPFKHSGGDLWFHIKGSSEQVCREIYDVISDELASITESADFTLGDKSHGGKVFGGRFIDGLANPVDPVNLSERIVVGEKDPHYRGSAYVLQQKFLHNWDRLDDMNAIEKENRIGRDHDNAIFPTQDERSHIKCVRKLNGERMTLSILRQALPYGHSPSARGNEEGVYFVAYGKSGDVFDDLIDGIRGPDEGYVRDKMLNNTHAIQGNFWFIPSAKEAGLSDPKGEVTVPINEYFAVRSANGRMFYNNRDYIHQLKAGSQDLEISASIVALLAETFDGWNDTWEKKLTMPSLGHLEQYLNKAAWKDFAWVGKASTALRKGLATRISLSDVLLREPFRLQADLFNIKPKEIIVGNMPPLTLGSGTRVMETPTCSPSLPAIRGPTRRPKRCRKNTTWSGCARAAGRSFTWPCFRSTSNTSSGGLISGRGRTPMGNDLMKKHTLALSLALALAVSPAMADGVDVLSLYRDMTQSTSQLEVRTGEPTQFSGSEKTCITSICADGGTQCTPTDNDRNSPLISGSDYEKYYGLSTGSDGYPHYGEDSQYAGDVATLTANMDRLMASFQRTGLRQELRRRGMTPALMFDLDNTLEFSAAPDSDPRGEGPAIQGLVDFAKRWCFKDGMACYFITARNCDESSVIPTEKWLKANLKLDDEKIRRYTHFSRNEQNLTCSIPGKPSVAYKDVIREELEQKEKVFWLMSVGDQLTDSLGEHSGMKIRVPNQFFHSDIVANQYAPWGVGQCGSPQTIAPPRDCAEKLLAHAIEYSSLEYCRKKKN